MARKCRACKTEIPTVKDSLPVQKKGFCDFDCMAAHGLALARKAQEKAQRSKHRADKERMRDSDRRYWLEKAQGSFNAWVRARDKGLPCISCGKPDNGDVRHASHFKSRGANSFLRYHPMNVNASCVKCNVYNSGALDGYTLGIIEKYGIEALEYLNTAPRVKRYDISYLKRLDIVCRKLAKRAAKRDNCM